MAAESKRGRRKTQEREGVRRRVNNLNESRRKGVWRGWKENERATGTGG